MSKKYYESRRRWNEANYKQINIAADPSLAGAFRVACERDNVSMRKVIVTFMAEYSAAGHAPEKKRKKEERFSTRGSRRKAVASIVSQLELVRDAEERYMENMPANLANSVRYESAEIAIGLLDDAIEALSGAFA